MMTFIPPLLHLEHSCGFLDVGIATFRFDCRGLGESTGATKYTPHFQNLQDLEVSVERSSNVLCFLVRMSCCLCDVL
jgi:hypothetical protein